MKTKAQSNIFLPLSPSPKLDEEELLMKTGENNKYVNIIYSTNTETVSDNDFYNLIS